jgi:hypothetical protein
MVWLAMLLLPNFFHASETVSVSFQTAATGGRWSPAHVVAVWIEKSDGTFVRTIGNWSRRRRYELDSWQYKAGNSDTDGVMGATITNQNALLRIEKDKAWKMLPRDGATAVDDGTYVLHMEQDDGREYRTHIVFEKNGQAALIGPVSQNGFRNIYVYYSGRSTTGENTFVMTGGDNQTGVVRQPLAQPLSVLMKDADNKPVVGVTVSFRVIIGDGVVSAAHVTTNTEGLALVNWTLGSGVGTQQLSATAVGFPALFFRATAQNEMPPGPAPASSKEPKSCGYGTGLSAFLLVIVAHVVLMRWSFRQR